MKLKRRYLITALIWSHPAAWLSGYSYGRNSPVEIPNFTVGLVSLFVYVGWVVLCICLMAWLLPVKPTDMDGLDN